MYESPHVRISEHEREHALAELTRHFTAGTLTVAEFDERSEFAMAADSRAQIAALFTDLPPAPPTRTTPGEALAITRARSAVRIGALAAVAVLLAVTFGQPLWLLLLAGTPIAMLAGTGGSRE